MTLLELEAYLHRELEAARQYEQDETERIHFLQPVDCAPRRQAINQVTTTAQKRIMRAHRTYQQTLEAYKEEHKHEWSR